ncbi:hypothetical protein COOONC_03448, partial [Cooperia oncophora]
QQKRQSPCRKGKAPVFRSREKVTVPKSELNALTMATRFTHTISLAIQNRTAVNGKLEELYSKSQQQYTLDTLTPMDNPADIATRGADKHTLINPYSTLLQKPDHKDKTTPTTTYHGPNSITPGNHKQLYLSCRKRNGTTSDPSNATERTEATETTKGSVWFHFDVADEWQMQSSLLSQVNFFCSQEKRTCEDNNTA